MSSVSGRLSVETGMFLDNLAKAIPHQLPTEMMERHGSCYIWRIIFILRVFETPSNLVEPTPCSMVPYTSCMSLSNSYSGTGFLYLHWMKESWPQIMNERQRQQFRLFCDHFLFGAGQRPSAQIILERKDGSIFASQKLASIKYWYVLN